MKISHNPFVSKLPPIPRDTTMKTAIQRLHRDDIDPTAALEEQLMAEVHGGVIPPSEADQPFNDVLAATCARLMEQRQGQISNLQGSILALETQIAAMRDKIDTEETACAMLQAAINANRKPLKEV